MHLHDAYNRARASRSRLAAAASRLTRYPLFDKDALDVLQPQRCVSRRCTKQQVGATHTAACAQQCTQSNYRNAGQQRSRCADGFKGLPPLPRRVCALGVARDVHLQKR